MRYIIVLIALLWSLPAGAQDWEDQRIFNPGDGHIALRVISSTDTDLFVPLIKDFLAAYPDVSVEYLVTGTADIEKRVRARPEGFDIVISSAMDLQLKLTNDGYARPLGQLEHPDWAQWRHSLFAFTSEPAAIVINRAAFDGAPIPQTRQELIEALRARPVAFHGKVGTYDVRQSGLGYLFATQDARVSETFWRLMEVMGGLDARLYCCSGQMIDDLMDGTLVVAYNVLGSYAAARTDAADKLEIILPSDFPTTMMRTVFVSAQTSQPDMAEAFVRHLIKLQSRANQSGRGLPLLDMSADGPGTATIPLEPALMTFLDALKRQKFLSEWENALIQD